MIEKSLNLAPTVKYIRVYEVNRICGCESSSSCKFIESTTSKTSPSQDAIDDLKSYRDKISNIDNETQFIGQQYASRSIQAESSSSLDKSSFNTNNSYYESSYISNLTNYIKVLNLNEKDTTVADLSPNQSDYRTCMESFGDGFISPAFDFTDFEEGPVGKIPVAADCSARTLDQLIYFLDTRESRSGRTCLTGLQHNLLKLDPRSQLSRIFEMLNQELFNRSLDGVCARWSKSSVGG